MLLQQEDAGRLPLPDLKAVSLAALCTSNRPGEVPGRFSGEPGSLAARLPPDSDDGVELLLHGPQMIFQSSQRRSRRVPACMPRWTDFPDHRDDLDVEGEDEACAVDPLSPGC